jgi:hypothetical protein
MLPLMRNRESAFRKGLRKLFCALGDACGTFNPLTASKAAPVLTNVAQLRG